MYCPNHDEQEIISSCRQHLTQEALRDAFVITCDRMRKYQGAWHKETFSMYPKYVFLESSDPERLESELHQYRDITQVLGEKDKPVPVCQEEEKLLKQLCGDEHHLGMSRGDILDGKTCVTEGPLVGMEDMIQKIDRHKRIAKIRGPVERIGGDICVGLEIVRKS